MYSIFYPNFKKFIIVLVVSLIAEFPIFSQDLDYKPPSGWSWGIEDSTEYFIYTPDNLKLGERYPIALYLHGCCGDSPYAIPHRTASPPVRMWHNFELNTQDIPTYIISPQTTRGWSQHFESLRKVIDFLVEKRQGDPQRVYIFGFSMGGRGLYEFISEYPDYFAAAMPLGMSFFNGDFEKIKDIPIWANQGELDRWASEMPKFIKETRALNGLALDSAYEWLTGVNPMYTSFEGLGHNVQWEAVTTQDITGWAYSKINDGNKYPNVFFEAPNYREEVKEGKSFTVRINAKDPDGTIDKVELYLNRKYHSTIIKAPYEAKITPVSGDNLVEAIAFDDKGKTNTATTTLVVDRNPVLLLKTLPYARKGAYYNYKLPVIGNGKITYSVSGYPDGIYLLEDGILRGIPMKEGDFTLKIIIHDEDGDEINLTVNFPVEGSRAGEVLIAGATDPTGRDLVVSKMVYGETPNFNYEKQPTSFVEDYSFSDIGDYYGLTFIKSEENDSTPALSPYMTFSADHDVDVLVAYEKFDNIHHSTIPDWLNDFTPQSGVEITAQLRYFDIFLKPFPAGKVTLPGGEKDKNGVKTNYFVMIRSDKWDNHPEINMKELPSAFYNTYYNESLSSLYGHGRLSWELKGGQFPKGLQVGEDGKITGFPESKGTYQFGVMVTDELNQESLANVVLEVK